MKQVECRSKMNFLDQTSQCPKWPSQTWTRIESSITSLCCWVRLSIELTTVGVVEHIGSFIKLYIVLTHRNDAIRQMYSLVVVPSPKDQNQNDFSLHQYVYQILVFRRILTLSIPSIGQK